MTMRTPASPELTKPQFLRVGRAVPKAQRQQVRALRSPACSCVSRPPRAAARAGAPSRPSGWRRGWTAGRNVCRCYTNGYTAAKRPPRILSETAS